MKTQIIIKNSCLALALGLLVFLSCSLPGTLKGGKATRAWVLACQNTDGGFGLYPGDGSNLLATYSAIKALRLLGAVPPMPEKISAFIHAKMADQGGFRNRLGHWPDSLAMINTYHAVQTLKWLEKPVQNRDKVIGWIHSRQYQDGGYHWDYYLPADHVGRGSIISTYCAVMALNALGEKPKNMDKLKHFMEARQTFNMRRDGSFTVRHEPEGETPTNVGLVCHTGMGLVILKSLGLAPLDEQKTLEYLLTKQRDHGGIAKGLGVYNKYDGRNVARMPDAYWAVRGLHALDRSVKDPKALAKWIASCLHNDGGYGRRPELCPTEMDATCQALVILKHLGEAAPEPEKPITPVRETGNDTLVFKCEPVFEEYPDEVRYLARIAKPIYDKYIGEGEFAAAYQLMKWVGDNQVFCSNWKHSGALTIVDGYATCGPKGRCYVSLANVAGIESRMLHLKSHGASESKINGKWVMMDPMFYDYGRDEEGNLKSALAIHMNYLKKGKEFSHFGDFRYENLRIEKPDGHLWTIGPDMGVKEAVEMGAYTKEDY
jgi:prenyltransferase beta subunit